MEKINGEVKLHVQLIGFLIIWGLIILVSRHFSAVDFWEAVRLLPEAISLYAVLGFIFVRWLWRWQPLQGWLVKIPDLQGTWRGELKSDWIDPNTNQRIAPIPVVLVIRQNFSHISCALMTAESSSYSTAADVNHGMGGDDLYLAYNYTNRPRTSVRDRSAIHDGAALLKIIQKPTRYLEGEYWTSRKTAGEIAVSFESRQLAEKI